MLWKTRLLLDAMKHCMMWFTALLIMFTVVHNAASVQLEWNHIIGLLLAPLALSGYFRNSLLYSSIGYNTCGTFLQLKIFIECWMNWLIDCRVEINLQPNVTVHIKWKCLHSWVNVFCIAINNHSSLTWIV